MRALLLLTSFEHAFFSRSAGKANRTGPYHRRCAERLAREGSPYYIAWGRRRHFRSTANYKAWFFSRARASRRQKSCHRNARGPLAGKRFAPENEAEVIRVHDMVIHPGRREVLADGRAVDLTYTEFQVLYYLASRPGWVGHPLPDRRRGARRRLSRDRTKRGCPDRGVEEKTRLSGGLHRNRSGRRIPTERKGMKKPSREESAPYRPGSPWAAFSSRCSPRA